METESDQDRVKPKFEPGNIVVHKGSVASRIGFQRMVVTRIEYPARPIQPGMLPYHEREAWKTASPYYICTWINIQGDMKSGRFLELELELAEIESA